MLKVHFPLISGRTVEGGLARALRLDGFTGAVYWTRGPERILYDELNARASEFFAAVDLDEADVVMYPYRASTGPDVEVTAALARSRGLPCIFFSWGDSDDPVEVSYGTVYRHSLYSDTRLPCERTLPCDVADPRIELARMIPPREKKDRPSVGFCGFVSNPIMRTIYTAAGHAHKSVGLTLRARALSAMRRVPGIRRDFVVRQSYWAGVRGRNKTDGVGEARPRAAFWNCVIWNDYTLCMRGAGNYSYRFYEVLAAGRIPVFINTRCVLPFEDQINWKEHCVWVEERDLHHAGEILLDFHARITPKQFRDMQIENRRVWEDWLRPLMIYRRVLRLSVDEMLNSRAQLDSAVRES